jgi:hypothetical protein
LALDGAWRSGHCPEAVCCAIATKQIKNERRAWPDWRTADRDKAISGAKGAYAKHKQAHSDPIADP